MTYRRLFHILLIGSTLVLGGVWWSSFRTGAGLLIETRKPQFTLVGDIVYANIQLRVLSPPVSEWSIDLRFDPASDYPLDEEEQSVMGSFEGFMDLGSEYTVPPQDFSCFLLFPVWVLWLLFIAGAWAFCRMMERRSKGGREKALAEESQSAQS